MPSLRTMPAAPAGGRRRLQTSAAPAPDGKTLRNFVVAEARRFSDGRGEFDETSLKKIIELWPKGGAGLKSRWTHPDESSDSLGQFLGRARDPRLSSTADGTPCLKADLTLDPTAFRIPVGGGGMSRGAYILDLARREPDALSSSLVLNKSEWQRKDAKGRPALDDQGEPLPPIWTPTKLWAIDIVGEGAAVGPILSGGKYTFAAVAGAARLLDGLGGDAPSIAGQWLDAYLRGDRAAVPAEAAALADRVFARANHLTIRARLESFLDRYFARKKREEDAAKQGPCSHIRILRRKLDRKVKDAQFEESIRRIRAGRG